MFFAKLDWCEGGDKLTGLRAVLKQVPFSAAGRTNSLLQGKNWNSHPIISPIGIRTWHCIDWKPLVYYLALPRSF